MKRSVSRVSVAVFALAPVWLVPQPALAFGVLPPAEAAEFCAAGDDYHFGSHGDCVMAVNERSTEGVATDTCRAWMDYVPSFASYRDCILVANAQKPQP